MEVSSSDRLACNNLSLFTVYNTELPHDFTLNVAIVSASLSSPFAPQFSLASSHTEPVYTHHTLNTHTRVHTAHKLYFYMPIICVLLLTYMGP